MIERDMFYIENSRINKVNKTVRGSLKKSIFYLGCNVNYKTTQEIATLPREKLYEKIKTDKKLYELYFLDAVIRFFDDILDEDLAKIEPFPKERARKIIDEFDRVLPEASSVSELFRLEIRLRLGGYSGNIVKEKITKIIEIRPSDYFLLCERAITLFGSRLDKENLELSWSFLKEFQRLRDLLDDIMSVEEDELKGSYNSIVLVKKNKIAYHFIDQIIRSKLDKMRRCAKEITKHPYEEIFIETLEFWESEYRILFKKLLTDYYISPKEFNKTYFLIKQL